MLATLTLMLSDNENVLKSVLLAPWLSWLLLIGAGYGFLRLVRDAFMTFIRRLPTSPPANPESPEA